MIAVGRINVWSNNALPKLLKLAVNESLVSEVPALLAGLGIRWAARQLHLHVNGYARGLQA